ncbi:MAG: SUMF1/EgtB/PvdO family nonheme iron enzyme [Planctomycetota bacterium]|jgi:formylglycine-generating enzyme required for sulfatase activity
MIEAEMQLDEALEEVVDRRARGEIVSMQEYEERHPHLALGLGRHLAVLEALDRLVQKEGVPLPEETCIAGYRIVREIGRGGMGVVFLAEQLSLHRLVALKLLSAPMARSHLAVERFRRESAVTARLRHPNIITVFDVGESEGHSYFAMEYVRGISIAQFLARLREMEPKRFADIDLRTIVREMLPADDEWEEEAERSAQAPARAMGYFGAVASIIADIADGLAYAHSHGVLHRDVNPQNILLDYRLTPQLADFGLAKEVGIESLSMTGDLLGTPYYMSPELVMAGRIDIDHRTDIYSLGVTMFEMLTLALPFSGSSSHEVLRRIMDEQPPSPCRLNPAVPRDLEVIALKAHRYQKIAEMAEDLRRFLRFETIHAHPPSLLRVAGRQLRRYRVGVIVALLVLVSTFVVAGVVSGARHDERLATARSLEDNEEWGAAHNQYARILKDFPEDQTARGGLERTGRIIDAKWRGLASAGKAHLEAEEYLPAVEVLTQALELKDDRDLRRLRDDALGVASVQISSIPPDATITIKRTHGRTARILPGDVLRNVPGGGGVARLPLGEYLVVVEKPGFGFGKYYLPVKRDRGTRRLNAILRPTAVVIDGMVEIPGGTYRIGHEDQAFSGTPLWLPEQDVEVESFYIDRTEVSNEQYLKFVQETGHPPPQKWSDGRFPRGGGKLPVVWISWDDARAYAEWAGKRLPTEIEWEVAARGKEALRYSWGNEFDASKANLGPILPRIAKGERVVLRASAPVTVDYPTADLSPFGVLHMVGNAREWVWDLWVPRRQPRANERYLRARGQRVVKGDSWSVPINQHSSLCASRWPRFDDPAKDVGFRCAKSKKP